MSGLCLWRRTEPRPVHCNRGEMRDGYRPHVFPSCLSLSLWEGSEEGGETVDGRLRGRKAYSASMRCRWRHVLHIPPQRDAFWRWLAYD